MPSQPKKLSADRSLALDQLHAARTVPTDKGIASCIERPDLYERLAVTTRPDPVDVIEAAHICRACPLFDFCPVAITTPGR